MEALKQKISQSIKAARLEKGLTQKELGALIGVSESAVNRYENGNLNMSAEIIYKIADAMNLDVNFSLSKR